MTPPSLSRHPTTKKKPASMYHPIVNTLDLLRMEKLMSALSRIALLALLNLSGAALAAGPAPAAKPAPQPNTHTVIIDGKAQTFANRPGAPVGGSLSAAYQFRTHVSTAPQCSRFAEEADAVFLNGSMPDEQKVAKLQAIESAAQAAKCLNP
jgi:hypothetical protein